MDAPQAQSLLSKTTTATVASRSVCICGCCISLPWNARFLSLSCLCRYLLHSLSIFLLSALSTRTTSLTRHVSTHHPSFYLYRLLLNTPAYTEHINNCNLFQHTKQKQEQHIKHMSGLKNSPFGKRLRASQHDTDDEAPLRNKPRVNPIFGVANLSTPSLDSRSVTDESAGPSSPVSRAAKEYSDRCVKLHDMVELGLNKMGL